MLDDDSRLFSVLPGESAEIDFVETFYGSVPRGSLLSSETSLQRKQQSVNQSSGTKKLKVCDGQEQLMLKLTPETIALYKRQQEEGYDIPDPQYKAWLDMQLSSTISTTTDIFQTLPLKKHSCGTLKPTKRISFEECKRIEQATIGQHLSSLWKDYHTKTIPSSNFKTICRRKEVTDAFVKWLLNPPEMVSENGMFGLVEIKCPYSVYDRTIQEACQKPNFCCEISNAAPNLKLDHEYYY